MNFPLTKKQLADLKKRQKKCRKDGLTVEHIKISVIISLDLGLKLETIANVLGVDVKTLSNYRNSYKNSKDLSEYLSVHYQQNVPCKLSREEIEVLKKQIDENLYTNCKAIVSFIKEKFGKEYTPNGLCLLLKRLGYTYKQTKLVPGKADIEEQKKFANKLKRLKKRLKKDEKIYFLDGVHPTHNVESVRVWTKKGVDRKVNSNTGRQRVNINGAMNADNPTDTIYSEDEKLNAEATIRLFAKILTENALKRRVYLICDNARYFKNKLVQEYLRKHRKLKLIHLPPYSPNLNLIERLWKLMRKKKLATHYYEDFKSFKNGILDFFDNLPNYEQELKTLITWNFHFPNK